MSNELVGLGGYASLMKSQKNPYERNIANTRSIIESMPKDGGVTGLERIGTLPLMYTMGQDQANAQQYDAEKAAEENQQLQGILSYQREQDARKMKLEESKAAAEIGYKNSQVIENAIKTATEMSKAGNEGEAIKVLRANGLPEVGRWLVTPNGIQAQDKDTGQWVQLLPGQPPQVWDTEKQSWRAQTDDDLKDNGNISLENGYQSGKHATFKVDKKTGDVSIVGTAPIKEGSTDNWSEKEDVKFYKQKSAEIRGLEQKADAGFKGQLVIDGTLHSFDGSKESQDALRQLANVRKQELIGNPTYATLVQKHDPQWIKKASATTGNITAVETKVVNGLPYFKGSDGKWYEGPR